MATVADIITDALEITGIKSPHDALETVWGTVGLRRVNSIIDGWNVDKTKGFTISEISTLLSTPKAVYTIGATGDIVATNRPVTIEKAFVTLSSALKYELSIVNFNEFKEFESTLASSANPIVLWYDAEYPTGKINLFPTPVTGITLDLSCLFGFTKYSAITDTVSLPQGMERLLTYQAAVQLPSHIGKKAPFDVVLVYSQIKQDIESINFNAWMPQIKIVSNTTPVVSSFNALNLRGI